MNRDETLLQTCVFSATTDDGEPQRLVQLLPMGRMATRNGQPPFILIDGPEHAAEIVTASQAYAGATEPVFDYDHQSVYGARPGVGGRAEAAGWIKRYEVREDGIWAEVDWTAAADAKLRAREYRYVSPVFHVERGTNRVRRIINATLTNTPNLDLAHVASALAGGETASASETTTTTAEDTAPMSLSKIAEALGLDANSTEEQILGMIEDWKTAKATMSATASALGLSATASADDIVAAASTAKAAGGDPDPSQYVPKAAFDELAGEVAKIREGRIEQAVASAVEAGKLMPSQRDWALKLGRKDEAELDAYLASAVPMLSAGASGDATGKPGASTSKLTEDEQHAASALGLTHDEYAAAKGDGEQKDA